MTAHIAQAGMLNLLGQAEFPPSVLFDAIEVDLWQYRSRTTALLKRYGRASIEVGRLPSLLGREFFRARISSYAMANFEDVVIFVTDMEQALAFMDPLARKLLGMTILEEYSIPEVSRLVGLPQRTVERLLQETLDQLTRKLLITGMVEALPGHEESCQVGKKDKSDVSTSKQGRNKCR